ncbi:recombinase family protein [Arthrobacter sp. Cr_A7]|nr:recombinase family protein [Arthrobacter sp. Cr_A7]MDF2048882.1 recombinase family protein [Arthrobacter sp. Cr_A7]
MPPNFHRQWSGRSKASRPELYKMLDHLRNGDEVVIWKLTAFGRNTSTC